MATVHAAFAESLTGREREVLKLIAAGQSTKQIAANLRVSFKTAACHRYRIAGKLGAHNTAELLRSAVCLKLVDWTASEPAVGNGSSGADGPPRRKPADLLAQNRHLGEELRDAFGKSSLLRTELRDTRKQLQNACAANRDACLLLLETLRQNRETSVAPPPPAVQPQNNREVGPTSSAAPPAAPCGSARSRPV